MRSGPSVTMVRTTFSSQSPAPASSVSRTCSSNESSSLVTHAIPPCAHAVLVSAPLRFVMTATEPCCAAFSAKLSPAIPLPTTTKSNSFTALAAAVLGGGKRHIVDQAGFADENRQHHARVRQHVFDWLQAVTIDHADIIDPSAFH